ncbi:ThuA domain-containing protein [bacterium]|nr:ThuA domain-containing protein [bacterium]
MHSRFEVWSPLLAALASILLAAGGPVSAAEAGRVRRVVFIAGTGSHGFGSHEHFAGCTLLAEAVEKGAAGFTASVHRGWPKDANALTGASAIVLYCDGGPGNLFVRHLAALEPLAAKGVGLGLLHYATVIPKGKPGDRALEWTGGYYETHWSVNPTWTAEFKALPAHPVANGVRPFRIRDEWYYHMRFRADMKGVTPILSAVPPEKTRTRPFGAHSGNAEVRRRTGMAEPVMWVGEGANGVRGFGFTGGHFHWNWAHDDFRTVVLNAVVWIAHGDVPKGGVPSKLATVADLEANMNSPRPQDVSPKAMEDMIGEFRKPYTPGK